MPYSPYLVITVLYLSSTVDILVYRVDHSYVIIGYL